MRTDLAGVWDRSAGAGEPGQRGRWGRWLAAAGALVLGVGVFAGPARGTSATIDELHRTAGEDVAARAVGYLLSTQDRATGGWSVPPAGSGAPVFPAITGLVLNGLLIQPGISDGSEGPIDPAVERGVAFILRFARDDGGIYDTLLPSYNTAICVSALTRVRSDEARLAVEPALEFLRRSQWGAAEPVGVGGPGGRESPAVVDASHPFFGGLGYGQRGRPDISNVQFMMQAFHDAGVPADDEAVRRAVAFLQRVQMLEKLPDGTVVNDQPYAVGSRQGGFIYATAENPQTLGRGQSFAGEIDETLSDGTTGSRLRAYGSVTYAGFKSYLYAGLSPEDPRVLAARGWITNHYTLLENPGIGTDGFYYYLVAFARALDAFEAAPHAGPTPALAANPAASRLVFTLVGPAADDADQNVAAELDALGVKAVVVAERGLTGEAATPPRMFVHAPDDATARRLDALAAAPLSLGGRPGTLARAGGSAGAERGPEPRNWRQDLIARLVSLQQPDGSFRSLDERWMEDNPQLITAYALIALQHALRD